MGTGHIRRTGQGRWRIVARRGWDPEKGRYTQSVETVRGTKRDAEARLRQLIEEIAKGTASNSARKTVEEYLTDDWLPSVRQRVRARTAEGYAAICRTHITPALGNVKLSKLRPAHVQRFEAGLLDRGSLSARTVLHVHRCLSAALAEAVRLQLIAVNPAAAVRPPRPEKPKLSIPETSDVARVLDAAAESRYYTSLLLAATTGMRRGEVLGLRWSEVDLEGSRLSITATLQRVGKQLVLAGPKTERSRRQIALPTVAVDALRAHRAKQNERRLLAGEAWIDRGLVFDNGIGDYCEPSEMSRALSRAAGKIGLPNLRLHDLRHAFATTLLVAGVHPKIVSEALGHATIAITLDTYSHVVPSLGDVAAKAIQSAYEGLV